MSSKVALVRCEDYDSATVHAAVARGLDLLGGASQFVHEPSEHLLLKPNVLVGTAPDNCVTTHPAVFRAVAAHLQTAGAHLTYGDSPGFGNPEAAAKRAGLGDVASELSIRFADFMDGTPVTFPQGDLIKSWFIANGVQQASGIISLPKMKTHGLSRVTGAVKNQFGCIPGMRKGEFHARMSNVAQFSRMLVDLNRLLAPRLYVMDGITAMEGNGPRSGDPKQMNVLLFSTDPVAIDATVCRMMKLDIDLVDTVTIGQELGLGSWEDVEYVGDPLESFIASEYNVNRSPRSTTESATGRLSSFMRQYVVPKPYIVSERCTACGTCIKVCPVDPKAVDWADAEGARAKKPPIHHYGKCIRCYCCQEMCPERAIEVKTPILGRIIHG